MSSARKAILNLPIDKKWTRGFHWFWSCQCQYITFTFLFFLLLSISWTSIMYLFLRPQKVFQLFVIYLLNALARKLVLEKCVFYSWMYSSKLIFIVQIILFFRTTQNKWQRIEESRPRCRTGSKQARKRREKIRIGN